MATSTPSRADIWKTFSSIKKSDNLNASKTNAPNEDPLYFVNWMDTLSVARKHFPDIAWENYVYEDGGEAYFFPDGTAEVKASIYIGDVAHTATQPVYDNDGAPIVNPSSHEINTAKKRVLCKCLGELGLFWQLWSDNEREAFVKRSSFQVAANDSVNIADKAANAKKPANEEVKADELSEADQLIKDYFDRSWDDLRKNKPKTVIEMNRRLRKIQSGAYNRGAQRDVTAEKAKWMRSKMLKWKHLKEDYENA